ncbi:hypothetical protein [Kitasatospora sp. GP82]|uniref:hypothetical protein n=1 Tax=Kitasatospora sp. GP82 TaxID=3035089 RepID=UPI0024768BB0|nr:hypothetical protein [Kitasatospora sp. GP82]MDH6123731.1 hypothetical protein [Kitasatospora sp. GP82]
MRRVQRLSAASLAVVTAAATLMIGAAAADARTRLTPTCSQAQLPLPDSHCQPGALNAAVTQATIGSTICVPGYTATVRPPTSYTNALKIKQIAQYGYSDINTADYEEDHLIALELGGNPTSPQNLWPEPRYAVGGGTAAGKDGVENKLHSAVCSHRVGLAAAQHAIATNWTTALSVLGL